MLKVAHAGAVADEAYTHGQTAAYSRGLALALFATAACDLLCNAVLGFVAFIKDKSPIKGLAAKPFHDLLQSGSSTCIESLLACDCIAYHSSIQLCWRLMRWKRCFIEAYPLSKPFAVERQWRNILLLAD